MVGMVHTGRKSRLCGPMGVLGVSAPAGFRRGGSKHTPRPSLAPADRFCGAFQGGSSSHRRQWPYKAVGAACCALGRADIRPANRGGHPARLSPSPKAAGRSQGWRRV